MHTHAHTQDTLLHKLFHIYIAHQNEKMFPSLLMKKIESYVALVLTKFNSKHPTTNSSISFSLTSLCWRFGL